MKKENGFVAKVRQWWNAGFLGKIGLGLALVILAAIIATVLRWIWNLGPIREFRDTISTAYADWRSPKINFPRE